MKAMNFHSLITIRCVYWEDFARLSKDAEIVTYEIDELNAVFRIYAMKENVFIYEEPLVHPEKAEIVEPKSRHLIKTHENASNSMEPSQLTIITRQAITKTLKCGISYSVTPRLVKEGNRWTAEFEYRFKPSTVSRFLSHAHGTPREHTIEGNITRIRV